MSPGGDRDGAMRRGENTPARHRTGRILGMFPAHDGSHAGGVQVAGRIAWQGLRSRLPGQEGAGLVFEYGPSTSTSVNGDPVVSARSRPGALWAVLRRRWPVELVLVWHMSLLRLLPFLRVPDASVVLVLHGIEAWRPQGWLTRALLRRVDLFLSDSQYTWERFLSLHPRYRDAAHRTVHLGIDVPLDDPIPVPADPPAVLMVSRLLRSEDYKGHREMVAAWPAVLEQHPRAELWIAGDGDLRPDLEQLVRARGLRERVRFWGRVSDDEKHELLVRCRCLAMPSRGEGFGLVYLEAMRRARPCLVSTVDAGQEIVNPPEAGLAVDPGHPQHLTEAVGRLLAPGPEWAQWSARARRRYEACFTAARFHERLADAIRDVPLHHGSRR